MTANPSSHNLVNAYDTTAPFASLQTRILEPAAHRRPTPTRCAKDGTAGAWLFHALARARAAARACSSCCATVMIDADGSDARIVSE